MSSISPNYWLTANGLVPNRNWMGIDLGCNVEVLGFQMKNTHNSIRNDHSTKDLKVELDQWNNKLIRNELLNEELPNSIDKVNIQMRRKSLCLIIH